MAQILDGKVVRDKIAEKLKERISRLGAKPQLAIIQIGDLAESNTYIRQKILFGEKIGAIVDHQKFPIDIDQEKLITHLSSLNSDRNVHGIIIQQPLPNHLDKNKIIDCIDPVKDVDGQTSVNIKLLFEGYHHPVILGIRRMTETPESDSGQARMTSLQGFVPGTTKGILTLLDYYKIPIASKKVTVVGRSSLVGKPTALAFLNRDATVTICHSETGNLKLETKNADILVVAVGKPNLITKDYVSKGQVIVDVGINVINIPTVIAIPSEVREKQSQKQIATDSTSPRNDKVKPESEPPARKLVGDVDFEKVSKIVRAITPVPGGVGPMTVASLFQNLLEAHKRQA